MRLSVVLPAYNEVENVRRFPTELLPHLNALDIPYEIIVVDDGSNDGTGAAAEALGIPQLNLIRHERNRGIGAAVKTAIAHAQGELTVMLDSDLTFNPANIRDLLARFERGGVDFVIGSPKIAGFGKDIQWYRRVITACATVVYSSLFGRRITAVSPIFRLYRTADLKALSLETDNFDITVEILFKLILAGKRYAEVGAPLSVRKFGVSKLNYRKEIRNHLRLVRKIVKWRLQNIFRR